MADNARLRDAYVTALSDAGFERLSGPYSWRQRYQHPDGGEAWIFPDRAYGRAGKPLIQLPWNEAGPKALANMADSGWGPDGLAVDQTALWAGGWAWALIGLGMR